MRITLDQRPDEFPPNDAWRRLKIEVEPVQPKKPGQRALSARETREEIRTCLRRHFLNPEEALGARAAYLNWEQEAERRGVEQDKSPSVRAWESFASDVKGREFLDSVRGEVWGRVDIEDLNFRQAMQLRPRMRM